MPPQMVDRLRASGTHLLLSLCVAAISTALVFWVWYPGPLAQASGVRDIFLILLTVDISLGPLITLCVFNRKKPELKRDLVTVGVIQIAALIYGLHTVYVARPVYVVFSQDRFDLVFANDMDDRKLADASLPEYRQLPLFGPRVAAAALPEDIRDRTKLMFDSLSGGDDLQHLPKYYRPYDQLKSAIVGHSQPLAKLKEFNPAAAARVDQLAAAYRAQHIDAAFVPLRGKARDVTVVIDRATGKVLEIADLRPWL